MISDSFKEHCLKCKFHNVQKHPTTHYPRDESGYIILSASYPVVLEYHSCGYKNMFYLIWKGYDKNCHDLKEERIMEESSCPMYLEYTLK